MLNERDESVVRSYARSGMCLDVLIKSFPQFTQEDITYAYKEEYGLLPIDISRIVPCS